MKKKLYLFLKISLAILILAFSVTLFCSLKIKNSAKGKTFNSIEKIHYNKVGVVLGTSKYLVKGGVNPYFKYRIEAAVQLFFSKKIDFILVSGDNSTMYYNEPKMIREELIKRGVPADKIMLDYAGFRTLDSVIRAKEIFGQTKVTFISQQFHNERAIYLAAHHGMEAIGFNAQDLSKRFGLKVHIREYFARTKAVFDILFNVKPKYLGEKITID